MLIYKLLNLYMPRHCKLSSSWIYIYIHHFLPAINKINSWTLSCIHLGGTIEVCSMEMLRLISMWNVATVSTIKHRYNIEQDSTLAPTALHGDALLMLPLGAPVLNSDGVKSTQQQTFPKMAACATTLLCVSSWGKCIVAWWGHVTPRCVTSWYVTQKVAACLTSWYDTGCHAMRNDVIYKVTSQVSYVPMTWGVVTQRQERHLYRE